MKVARNRFSNVDSSIPRLLAILRQIVFALFSLSSEFRTLFLSKTCENLRTGFDIFSCVRTSSLTILFVTRQRYGALVPVPLLPSRDVRDVDRHEVAGIGNILLSIHGLAANFCTSHSVAI